MREIQGRYRGDGPHLGRQLLVAERRRREVPLGAPLALGEGEGEGEG